MESNVGIDTHQKTKEHPGIDPLFDKIPHVWHTVPPDAHFHNVDEDDTDDELFK
jgi:hypothetical protein